MPLLRANWQEPQDVMYQKIDRNELPPFSFLFFFFSEAALLPEELVFPSSERARPPRPQTSDLDGLSIIIFRPPALDLFKVGAKNISKATNYAIYLLTPVDKCCYLFAFIKWSLFWPSFGAASLGCFSWKKAS